MCELTDLFFCREVQDELALVRLSGGLPDAKLLWGIGSRPQDLEETVHDDHIKPVTQGAHLGAYQSSPPVGQLESRDLWQEKHAFHRILRSKKKQHKKIAQNLLVVATFACTVTLSVILTRSDPEKLAGIQALSLASVLFLATVAGCISLIISVELGTPLKFIRLWTLAITIVLFAAFCILLGASSIVQGYRGQFITGAALFAIFCLPVIPFLIMSFRGRKKGDEEARDSSKG